MSAMSQPEVHTSLNDPTSKLLLKRSRVGNKLYEARRRECEKTLSSENLTRILELKLSSTTLGFTGNLCGCGTFSLGKLSVETAYDRIFQ